MIQLASLSAWYTGVMAELPDCPICTMPDPLTTDDGFECATCGHEWLTAADDGLSDIRDANGNLLADGDAVTIIKDLKTDGKAGGVKSGTKIKSIRLVSGDHEIDAKVDGRQLLIKAAFVKKA
jgi:protein PhnA